MTTKKFYRLSLALILLVGLTRAVLAQTLHVPTDYATIQAAIDDASEGDQVWVAAGTYYEHVVLKSYVDLLGGFESVGWTRDISSHPTIIDGSGSGNVVYLNDDGHLTFDGFIVRNGDWGFYVPTTPSVWELVISNNEFIGVGIQIQILGSTIIKNNSIHDVPTGIYGALSFRQPLDLSIINNLIYNNYSGCYTYHEVGTIRYINNTIVNCGWAIKMQQPTSHVIANNILANNGTGIENTNAATYSITNNILWGNSTDYKNVTPGGDNLSSDPKFWDVANNNYHILPDSPGIDAGTNAEPDLPATDLNGNPRIADGNGDGAAVVDLGVYESSKFYPVADAGPDQTVDAGATVSLDGTNSTDPDDGIYAYAWSQTAGTTVMLSDAGAVKPTFTAPEVASGTEILTFQLTVTDNSGLQAVDTVAVQVNHMDSPAPSGSVAINGNAIYTNDPQVSITLNCSNAQSMAFSNDNITYTDWEDFGDTRAWELGTGDGLKTAYVKIRNDSGDIAELSDTIVLDTTPPASPVIVELGTIAENEPILDWEVVDDAQHYVVEYASNADFSRAFQSGDMPASQYTIPSPLSDGQWFWRVAAVDAADNQSPWSTGSFWVAAERDCPGTPEAPALITPANDAVGLPCNPVFETLPFVDPTHCGSHTKTRWQIHSSSDFSGGQLININTGIQASATNDGNAKVYDGDLTHLALNENTLKPNQTYYWRVRFWSTGGNKSEWSQVFAFTTAPSADDHNDDGIPDSQAVGDLDDLDGDGIADNLQPGEMKSVKTKKGDQKVGVRPLDCGITRIEALNDDDLPDAYGKPGSIPNGLLSFRLVTPHYGQRISVKIYLSEPAPPDAYWVMYDRLNGWYDYSANAVFNTARDVVTLELRDGGEGDADYTENGLILDPGGLAVPSRTSQGSGACFIQMARDN